jgi:hypothetical protein
MVEIFIVVLAMFFVIFQFMNIPPVNTEWSESKLLIAGTDLLHVLDWMGVDWADPYEITALIDDAITRGNTKNSTIIYDLKLSGVVKPYIKVGCICRSDANPMLDELTPIRNALIPFYLNGRNITFDVDYIDPASPVLSHEYDVIIIAPDFFKGTFHPPNTLDGFRTQITNFLGAGKGIIAVHNYTAAMAAPGTTGYDLFGVNWSSAVVQDADLSMVHAHDASQPNSSYFDVYKFFYGFPNASGLKTSPSYRFTNLLDSNDRTVIPPQSSASCGLEDNNGVCGLIMNRGMSDGSGRTVWLSQFKDPLSGDDGNNVLLRSVVSWLAGDIYHVINNENMNNPMTSRLFRMNNKLAGQAGMAGLWLMDEESGTASYDSSGNINHCNISGTQRVGGVAGNALRFDGSTSDYLECGDSRSLNLSGQELTLMAWVYPVETSTGGDYHFIIDKGNAAAYSIEIYGFGGQVRFRATNTSGSQGWIRGSTVVPVETWTHVAGVINSTGDMKIYLNGNLDGISATSPTPFRGRIARTDDIVAIGAKSDTLTLNFNGTIDQPAVFGRALTREDIRGYVNFPDQFMFLPTEIMLTFGYIY